MKEGAQKLGSIVSLGDKCDSCVILQICGRCHDDANDPGFEFEVEAKIEAQRHGTIEAGTGKPIGDSAGANRPRALENQLVHAFSLLDSAGRTRIEAAIRGLRRRGERTLGAWRGMLTQFAGTADPA